MTIRPKTI